MAPPHGLRQALFTERLPTAQGGRAHQRGSMANRRPAPRPGSAPRVPELSRQCRIRSHLTQKCSRSLELVGQSRLNCKLFELPVWTTVSVKAELLWWTIAWATFMAMLAGIVTSIQ